MAEADNGDKARAMMAPEFGRHELVVPAVVRERSGGRVLTMEWVDGTAMPPG